MKFLDEIKLCFGHSLLVGNAPTKLTLEQISNAATKQQVQEVERFGIFETSTPNYTTYYPDVTAADLVPQEGDFIEPIFRALSEVIVHKNSNPIDFGVGNVLKASMSKLLGQTINVDHETATGNAIGAVSDVFWQDSYKAGNITVPAGINAKLKIDGKSNPRLARGIMMDPPSIHSTSVTVAFLWEKSHGGIPDQDFFSKLGSFDKDGQMYRRIATMVKAFREISLVGHGADPFAMKVDENGKIVNPKYANTVYNSAAARAIGMKELIKNEKFFFFDYREDVILNSENHTIPLEFNEEETSNTEDMKELALALGLAETATAAEILAALTAVKTKGDSVATLQADVTRLNGEITTLKAGTPSAADIAELAALRTATTERLTARRAEVLASYNRTTKTPKEAITAAIAGADLATLAILEETYKADIERLFPATCKKCGGKEISRASATVANESDDNNPEEGFMDRILEKKRNEGLVMSGSTSVAKK